MIAWLKRAYQAAKSTPQHPSRPVNAHLSPDGAIADAGTNLREWARHLEENTDLATAVLDELVNQTVGEGIGIEPAVRNRGPDGRVTGLNDAANEQLAELYESWAERPEVTNQLPWSELQRLVARAWFRDGEAFLHHVQGRARGYRFEEGRLPYAIELLEADLIPLDTVPKSGVLQGVELDGWHRPRAYRVLKEHPGMGGQRRFLPASRLPPGFSLETKRVPVEQMDHIAFRRRFPQVRGVSVFAAVLKRMHSLHDYEESETIAARTAARIALWIKKDPDVVPETQDPDSERPLTLPQGTVYDDLGPGEDIGSASVDRPNPQLEAFIAGQLRRIAAGTGSRYSAVARDFNGTYSAQRQELMEARHAYAPLTRLFIARVVRPVQRRVIETALLDGRLRPIPGLSPEDWLRSVYVGPAIPFIDPLREVDADVKAIDADLATRESVIRRRGGDPREVPERERERQTTPTRDPQPIEPDGDATE